MRPRIPNAWRIATQRQLHSTPRARVSQSVLAELEKRGFIAALTHPQETITAHLSRPTPATIYSGVDPSASSLHVGNLLPLLGLLHLTANGHKSLALIGGATGSIGDPSGRSTERNALSQEELEGNVAAITGQVHRFFDRGMAYAEKRGYGQTSGGRGGVEVVNNLDWTKGLGMLDFLRTVGKVARVNIMLSRDRYVFHLCAQSPGTEPITVSRTACPPTLGYHSPNSRISSSKLTTFTTSTRIMDVRCS
jgi:tyrosyl-tRNA synthetase